MKFFANPNLNAKQKGLVLVSVPVVFQLVVSLGLTLQIKAAGDELLNLDRERAALMQMERAGSTGAKIIFAVGSLAQNENPQAALEVLQTAQKQIASDSDFRRIHQIAQASTKASGPAAESVSVESATFSGEMARLIEHSLRVLSDSSLSAADRFSRLRPHLFSAGMSFENLSRSIVKLESRSKTIEPAKLAQLRGGFFISLVLFLFSGLIITISLTSLFARDIVARLAAIGENAAALARGGKFSRASGNGDEIGLLDGFIHETGSRLAKLRRKELAVLENTTELIFTLDDRLKFQSMNRAAEEFWQVEKDGLMQQSLLSLVPEFSAVEVRRRFDQVRLDGEGELETSLRDGGGRWRVLLWTVNWRDDQKLFNCVCHDVSEKRHIERLKQELAAMVNHDLRSPLASLWLSISLVSGKQVLPEAAKARLAHLETQIEDLSSLMDRLLEIDRLSSGRALIEKEILHAYNLVSAATENCTELARARGVSLRRGDADSFVEGDQAKLVQALTAVMRFSIGRALAEAWVKLDVSGDKGWTTINVVDNGPLITIQERRSLLEKYAPRKGMDLDAFGLITARAVLLAHGGNLTVTSDAHETTFSFSLPTAEGASLIDEEP